MKHSQKRTFMDIEKMSSDEFKAFCRLGNKNHFTRIRKMPLQDLLFTMINRKGLTLALELRNYMKLAHPGVSISKPGYLKQRMKLNPDAFLELYKYHNRNFYADSTFSTYKNHLILAADGSDINIPTTTETLKLYGSASRKNTKPQAQIGLGCIYDVMNRMILESDCNKVKFDEMRLAEKQMERIPETIGNIPYIIIMDRGYPSTPAFIHMMDKDLKFIVRLKSSDYKKEQSSLTENDQLVKIKLDKSRIRHYEGTPDGERMKELGEISLRMVKILLENGNLEVLATNLSQTEFHTEEINALQDQIDFILMIIEQEMPNVSEDDSGTTYVQRIRELKNKVKYGGQKYDRKYYIEGIRKLRYRLDEAYQQLQQGHFRYAIYQTARAMRDVVKDQGGWAGIGAEIVLANTMAQNVQKMTSSMECEKSRIEKLRELKELLDEGILTQEEFCAEKKRVLEK